MSVQKRCEGDVCLIREREMHGKRKLGGMRERERRAREDQIRSAKTGHRSRGKSTGVFMCLLRISSAQVQEVKQALHPKCQVSVRGRLSVCTCVCGAGKEVTGEREREREKKWGKGRQAGRDCETLVVAPPSIELHARS